MKFICIYFVSFGWLVIGNYTRCILNLKNIQFQFTKRNMKSKVCSNMFRIDSFELFKSVPNWHFRSLFKSSLLRIVCSNLFPIDIFELFKLFPIDNFEPFLKINNGSKLFPIEIFMHVGHQKGKKMCSQLWSRWYQLYRFLNIPDLWTGKNRPKRRKSEKVDYKA